MMIEFMIVIKRFFWVCSLFFWMIILAPIIFPVLILKGFDYLESKILDPTVNKAVDKLDELI